MIESINNISLKFLRSNKFVIISSIFSVFLSVSLIISMFMFTLNAREALKDNFRDTYGNMDLSVGIQSIYDKKLDKVKVNNISSIAGIEEFSKVIIGSMKVGSVNTFDVYTVGLDNTKLSKSKYKYTKNMGINDVIINKGLSERLGVGIDDRINVRGNDCRVAEITQDVNQDVIYINIDKFKEILNDDSEATYLLIKLTDNKERYKIADKIRNLNYGLRIDIAEEDEFMNKNISYLNMFMVFLSILVIIMCSLFIISNFQTFLYNYRRQFAIIRSIGGTSKQAFKIVFTQATFINIVGVVLGVVVSIFTSKYLIKFLSNQLSIKVSNIRVYFNVIVVIAFILFLVIEIFMIIPAIRSSRILPLKIIHDNEELEVKGAIGKEIAILGLIVSALLFIAELYYIYNSKQALFLGVASAIVFIISIYTLFPYYSKNILNLLLPVFKLIGGNGAVVAIKNLIPQVKKNSIIIISLSTIVIISMFGPTFLNSILESEKTYLKSQFAFDISITDVQGNESKLGRDIKAELEAMRDVRNVSILSKITGLYYKADPELENADYSLADLQPLIKESIIAEFKGDIKSSLVISKKFAVRQGLKVGDVIKIKKFENNGKSIREIDANSLLQSFKVGAIVDQTCIIGWADITIDWSNSEFINKFTVFDKAIVSTNNIKNSIDDLNTLKGEYPQIKYSTFNDAFEQSKQIVMQRWSLFIIILITIILSIIMGIINMFCNNILSKRKEYAILRTLKLTKIGIMRIIITQVIAYIALGSLLGIFMGMVISNLIRDNLEIITIKFMLPMIVILIIVIMSLMVFIPFSNYISNKKIADEIKCEEK